MTESEHKQSVHISRASILLLNFQQSDRAHMRNKRHIAIDFKLLHIIITRQKEDMQRQILPRCKIYPANLKVFEELKLEILTNKTTYKE